MRSLGMTLAIGAVAGYTALTLGGTAGAATPTDAIGAIAVSPDGATVVATGNPRVFYVLDAETLEVRNRVWHGYNPKRLSWSKDGGTLAMFHTDDVVTFFDARTLAEKSSTDKFTDHCFAAGAEKLVTVLSGREQGGKVPVTLAVYSLASGEKLSSAEIDYTAPVTSIACSPDAADILIATREYDTTTEEKKNPPQDLPREEQAEFRKRHDAKAMWVGWFDGELKKGPEFESWFSSSAPALFFIRDGKALWLRNASENAQFGTDGSVEMKALTRASSFYGQMASDDHGYFLVGTLGKGQIVTTQTLEEVEFAFPDRLKGWPEYLYGFAIAPDGTIYGGTSGYRMMKISPEGKVLDMKPVH